MSEISFESHINLIQGLGFPSSRLPILDEYMKLLWKSNEELNLISRKQSFNDLVANHLIDCLLAFPEFLNRTATKKKIADLGTGGGLPGIVYAIACPQLHFILFEKSPRKQEFLSKCKKLAPNIQIEGDLPTPFPEVDLIISRAFKPVDVILEMTRNYYLNYHESSSDQAQGVNNDRFHYFLLKGRKEKIAEEIRDAKKKFKTFSAEVIELKSPLLEVERHLVLF